MSEQEFDAKPLKGYRMCIAPNSPTLGVFFLETTDGSSPAFVVIKQIALDISSALARLADQIAESQ